MSAPKLNPNLQLIGDAPATASNGARRRAQSRAGHDEAARGRASNALVLAFLGLVVFLLLIIVAALLAPVPATIQHGNDMANAEQTQPLPALLERNLPPPPMELEPDVTSGADAAESQGVEEGLRAESVPVEAVFGDSIPCSAIEADARALLEKKGLEILEVNIINEQIGENGKTDCVASIITSDGGLTMWFGTFRSPQGRLLVSASAANLNDLLLGR